MRSLVRASGGSAVDGFRGATVSSSKRAPLAAGACHRREAPGRVAKASRLRSPLPSTLARRCVLPSLTCNSTRDVAGRKTDFADTWTLRRPTPSGQLSVAVFEKLFGVKVPKQSTRTPTELQGLAVRLPSRHTIGRVRRRHPGVRPSFNMLGCLVAGGTCGRAAQ